LDLSRPESLGLHATRHFCLKYEDGDKNKVSVAAWHIIPNHIVKRFHKQLQIDPETLKNVTATTNNIHYNANYHDENDPVERSYKVIEAIVGNDFDIHDSLKREYFYEEILRKTKDPIVLYFHGNTGTRANGHRVELYKVLRKLGYHVIAIDYRGFADSSDQSPTEKGCVSDALATYKYIKNLTNNPIFIYGHSLGNFLSHFASFFLTSRNIGTCCGGIGRKRMEANVWASLCCNLKVSLLYLFRYGH
jgi:abhydrolase domain-containing protein 12